MRNLLLAAVSATLLATASAGQAADVAAVYKMPPAPSWTGLYAGLSLGARLTNSEWGSTSIAPTALGLSADPNPSRTFSSTSARIGGYLGYNWMIAPLWVAGIEADTGWGNNKNAVAPIPGTVQINFGVPLVNQPIGSINQSWDASLRGRFGRLIRPDTLLFGTAGVAWQQVGLTASCPANGGVTNWCSFPHNESYSKTKGGWTLGGGIEHMIGNWIIRGDYRYTDDGTIRQAIFSLPLSAAGDDRLTANLKLRSHALNVGVAYKF
jgi:outer membrane immunogenic protein